MPENRVSFNSNWPNPLNQNVEITCNKAYSIVPLCTVQYNIKVAFNAQTTHTSTVRRGQSPDTGRGVFRKISKIVFHHPEIKNGLFARIPYRQAVAHGLTLAKVSNES